MTHVKIETENNYNDLFSYAGNTYSIGQDFKLGSLPLTVALDGAFSSWKGNATTQPCLWQLSARLTLGYHAKIERFGIDAGVSLAKGFGRVKHNDSLEDSQPCQFLSACQFDRMLGGFSSSEVGVEIGISYDAFLLSGGVKVRWFDANDGVVVPSDSLGWFIGIGLRL